MTTRRPMLFRGLPAVLAVLVLVLAATSSAEAATGYRFSRSFAATGNGALSNPGRIAVAPTTDNVFVVDRDSKQVRRFTKAGDYLNAIDFGDRVDTDSPFVAVDPASGDVYVAKDDTATIVRYHADGGYASTVNLAQGGGITRLGGIAVDSVGRLYVSDLSDQLNGTQRNVVQVFSNGGTRTSQFNGSNGGTVFTVPRFLATGASNSIYVNDSSKVVQRFSALGAARQSAVQIDGDEYAVDSANGDLFSVASTNASANGVTRFTAAGAREARFAEVPGDNAPAVGVDPSNHALYLSVIRNGTPRVEVFQPFPAPDVSTDAPATDVTGKTAQVSGSVNPRNRPTSYVVRYSFNFGDAKETRTTDPVDIGAGNAAVPVGATLTGLRPNTLYQYQVIATNDLGSNDGETRQFATEAIAPTVSAASASSIASTGATLSFTANPENSPATGYVDYGPTSTYGQQTAERRIGSGDTTSVSRSDTLTDLQPNTTYHYRVVTKNQSGAIAEGEDQTFTTAPAAPAVGASADSAQFTASVSTGGQAGTVSFLVTGTNNAYAATVGSQSLPAAPGVRDVSGSVSGLPAGGTYTVRVQVQTAGGIATGDASTFSTAAPVAAPAPAPFVLTPFAPLPVAPSNRFTTTSSVKGSAATVSLKVPGRGTVSVKGSRIGRKSASATKAGTVRVKVRLTKSGRAALRKAKSKRLRVPIAISYRPTGGTIRAAKRTLTFRR